MRSREINVPRCMNSGTNDSQAWSSPQISSLVSRTSHSSQSGVKLGDGSETPDGSALFKLKSTTKIHWLTAPFGLITAPFQKPSKPKRHKVKWLTQIPLKGSGNARKCISWDSHRSCQLGPGLASPSSSSSSTAHEEFTAWTPATLGWLEPAEQFHIMPAEAKSLASLLSRKGWAMPPTFAVYPGLSGVASVSAGRLAPVRGPSGSVSLTAWPFLPCTAWRLKESQVHPEITAQPMAPTGHGRLSPNSVVKILTYFKINLDFLK